MGQGDTAKVRGATKGEETVRKQLMPLVGVLAMTLGYSPVGSAQTSDEFKALREEIGALKEVQALRREVEGLREGQRALQRDLQEIKALLQARPAAGGAPAVPQNVVFNLDSAHMKGEQSAKLVLVEFTDYQ